MRFHLTDLGTFGGPWATANAINEKGQVVGTFGVGNNGSMCFLWQAGVAPVTFQGDEKPFYCDAQAIGSDGTIAGAMRTTKSNPWLDAFRRDPSGNVVMLKALPGTGVRYGINDSWGYGVYKKTVVGMSKEQAVTWNSGGAVTAISPGMWSAAYGVNSSSQIVGWGVTLSNNAWVQAFLWQSGSFTYMPSPVGNWSIANAINRDSYVAMTYLNNPGGSCVEEWFGGAVTESACGGWTFSTAIGYAQAISIDHWIVTGANVGYGGCSGNPDWGNPAWCYNASVGAYLIVPDPSCSPTRLDSLLDTSGAGWSLRSATGINDQHQIVGYGFSPADGLRHAILLTPINSLPLCYPT